MKFNGMNFLFAVFLMTASTTTYAVESREFYTGIRGLGMGGAQIATVNDETALLINPAGLGKLRDYFITVADPEISLGSGTEGLIGSSLGAPLDPQEVLSIMSEPGNQSKRLHSKFQLFPSAVFPNFGLGFYGGFQTDAAYDATVVPNLFEFNYVSDLALVFGFNFRIWDGRIKFGFNTRVMNRNEILRTDIDVASTGLTIENLAKEGVGIASDVGLIVTMPWKWLPTLAAVYKDVGDTTFSIKDKGLLNNIANNPPDKVEGDVDVAIALFPIAGKRTRTAFSIEYRGVLTASDEDDSAKRLHTGIEFNFSDAFFLRAGMNQRYWTAGLEIAVANYQLQLASYGEEVGTAAANVESRRFIGKFAYRF